jgi:predicted transcriptional regulator
MITQFLERGGGFSRPKIAKLEKVEVRPGSSKISKDILTALPKVSKNDDNQGLFQDFLNDYATFGLTPPFLTTKICET